MPRYPDVSRFVADLSADVFSHLAERAKQVPGPIYPLHVGDTYLEPLPEARAEAQRTDDTPHLHTYAPVQGEPTLLSAIEASLARRLAGSHAQPPARAGIQVMSGATAGLTCVCTALLNPGDEVILPAPYWPLIRGIIRARGAVPVEVPLFDRLGDPGFDPVGAIEAALSERTAAIYLNTPNNPSGAWLDETQLAQLGALAEGNGLWVISDEVYEDLYYGETPPPTPYQVPALAGRTVATHSLSKAYGMAGARVGYSHGPTAIMENVRGVQTFFTYCAPRPLQRGAAIALEHGQGWLADARNRYREAALACAEVVGVPAPAAGTFLFFPATPFLRPGETTDDLLLCCLDAGVMLTPGRASGEAYADWVRLCFTSVDPDTLALALKKLSVALGPRAGAPGGLQG